MSALSQLKLDAPIDILRLMLLGRICYDLIKEGGLKGAFCVV